MKKYLGISPFPPGLNALDDVPLLTLIAMMQLRTFSLFTQEKAGALTTSALHFSCSLSDVTHHFTVLVGAANTLAANTDGYKRYEFRFIES